MNADSKRSLLEFTRAIARLKEYLDEPIQNHRDKSGIIQGFEFTYEIGWKTLRKAALPHGKTIGSAKQAFQAALELGWIPESEHEQWMQMIEDRNLTSHTYREELADQILARIRSQHFGLLSGLASRLGVSLN
jgi:nucleotidyltransferase substrate binding protein (TIGR01987 family)